MPETFPEGNKKIHMQNIDELGKLGDTAARFNLARPNLHNEMVRDVIAENEVNGFGRFLIIDAEVTDSTVYNRLSEYHVPQLPLIAESGEADNNRVIFGIKEGLKPLAHEGLFSRASSETYISDEEIFSQLGKLYRQAWEATGQILLDPHNPADSPLNHVALASFADNSSYLFLCPPYAPDSPKEVDLSAAHRRFSFSLQDVLGTPISSYDQGEQTSHLASLMQAAEKGFLGA